MLWYTDLLFLNPHIGDLIYINGSLTRRGYPSHFSSTATQRLWNCIEASGGHYSLSSSIARRSITGIYLGQNRPAEEAAKIPSLLSTEGLIYILSYDSCCIVQKC